MNLLFALEHEEKRLKLKYNPEKKGASKTLVSKNLNTQNPRD
jgi:hypothetical protein